MGKLTISMAIFKFANWNKLPEGIQLCPMSISSTPPTKFSTLTSSTPHMRVSINGGTPKWMVYNGKSQQKMDENWGYPYDLGNLHMDP